MSTNENENENANEAKSNAAVTSGNREVRDWLNDNDDNDILSNVIGKYTFFEDIADWFDTKEKLTAQFTNDNGHLAVKLMKKLRNDCNWDKQPNGM